jgi:hypothetical protein
VDADRVARRQTVDLNLNRPRPILDDVRFSSSDTLMPARSMKFAPHALSLPLLPSIWLILEPPIARLQTSVESFEVTWWSRSYPYAFHEVSPE